ncbi:MAG: ExbD/TolR family protein [Flavobacteriales bacterium]
MDFGRRNKIHVEPAMSALSDIIFMLLIFFIMASTLAVNGEKINLPKSDTAGPNTATTTLILDKDLNYQVNGKDVAKGDVVTYLKAFMADKDDKRVILVIDASVPTGNTIELFSLMKKNEWQPVIATQLPTAEDTTNPMEQ